MNEYERLHAYCRPTQIRGPSRAYVLGQFGTHLAVQPDLQFVIHPNTDPRIKNGVLLFFGLKFRSSIPMRSAIWLDDSRTPSRWGKRR